MMKALGSVWRREHGAITGSEPNWLCKYHIGLLGNQEQWVNPVELSIFLFFFGINVCIYVCEPISWNSDGLCHCPSLTFWLYWTAFDAGSPNGTYKAPYAVIYREMAILGIEGFSELPKHCLALCCWFFVAALVINLLRDATTKKIFQFIPIPMAMAVPFYIGAYFVIDMFVGTVILFIWERMNRKGAEDYAGTVASGLICGDGIWTIPSAILSIFRINPPICMYFGPFSSS